MKKPVSIILTCLNETEIISECIPKVREVLKGTSYEPRFIVVDDGSDSTDSLKKLLSQENDVELLFHPKNMGRGKSIADGILVAKTEYVAFIDPDLELPAEALFNCLLALQSGAQVVTAKRYYNFAFKDFVRVVLSRGYSLLAQLILNIPLSDTEAGLKAFDRSKIIPILKQTQDMRWFWDTEIMARSYFAHLKIKEVPTVVVKRDDKPTTVRLFRDAWIYFWSLIRFRLYSQVFK